MGAMSLSKTIKNDLFNNLSDFGLDDLTNVSIYEVENKNTDKSVKVDVSNPIETMIFEKTVNCPVCSKTFKAKAVKSSSVRMLSKDSDFMIRYKDPNPSLYDVWLCSNCGYAALSAKFCSITDKQIKMIKEKISSKWKISKIYPHIYNEDVSIEMHQLALLNAIVKSSKDSEKAIICLKIAWLHRLKSDESNEKKYLLEAIKGFTGAIAKEYFPIAGMDAPSLTYLIGELYRRIGENQNALLWFSKVLTDRNANQKIKDITREQRDNLSQKA